MSVRMSIAVSGLALLAALAAGCGGGGRPAPRPAPPPAPRFSWPAKLVADVGLPAAPEKPGLEAARVDAFVELERKLRGELRAAGAEQREAARREAGFKDAAEHQEFARRLGRAFEVLQSLRVLEKMEEYGGLTASFCRAEVIQTAKKEGAELGLSEPDLRLLHDKSAALIELVGK
jgi:hypothetical protein